MTRLLSPAAIELAKPFFEQMRRINNQFGEDQVAALRKLHNFVRDPSLESENQYQIREDCLREWGIPDKSIELMPERIFDPDRCSFLDGPPPCIDVAVICIEGRCGGGLSLF